MKNFKHLLGWLFNYCPYGKGCPPNNIIKENNSGGGC